LGSIIPYTITAGVNFCATAWRAQFSAAEWTLVLMLRGPAVIDLTAARDGARHVWSVGAAETAAWSPGEYSYAIRAATGRDVLEVESGRVRVLPNLALVTAGFDGRTPNRVALDNIEAVLAKRATLDQERYRINNRELYRTPIGELIRLRGHYTQQVAREEAKRKGQSLFGRQIKVVMKGSC